VCSKEFRVLHILDHLSPASGVASVVMNYVIGIPKIKQDIAIYGQCDAAMRAQIEACGGKIYKLPDVTKSFGRHFSEELSKLLRTGPHTIIHGHLINSAFIYLCLAKKAGVPHRIIHSHSSVSADVFYKKIRNNMLAKLIPPYATDYIAVSELAAQNAFGKSLMNLSIIHNGIDTNRFSFNPDVRREVRQELGLSEETLCVGHVARLVGLKNQEFLLNVFQKMHDRENCTLIIAGDGPMEGLLKEHVKAMGLADNVQFLGQRNDAHRLYQAFDVFLLPSLSEGFGLSVVEAQCAGLPCVVSEHVPQTVKCSANIRFLPLGNAQIWADTALGMSKIPRKDGADAVTSAKLDSGAMCDKVKNIYQSMRTELYEQPY